MKNTATLERIAAEIAYENATANCPKTTSFAESRQTTGYRVWVGAKSRWHYSLRAAEKSYQRCRCIHGDALVQLQDVRTGQALKGGRS